MAVDRDLVDRYRRDGFVKVPGFLAPTEVAGVTNAIELANERDAVPNALSLASMRFKSNLFYDRQDLQDFLASPAVVGLVCALLGADDVWVRWDQAVWKGPGAPEFPWHQDNGYTQLPSEHLQLWVALTESHGSNGGLVVEPGGHRSLRRHWWVGDHLATDPPATSELLVSEAGDVVAFTSMLPHSTPPNVTDSTRVAYVAEFLPLDVPDVSVRPPHFVIALGGEPFGKMVGADASSRP